MRRFPIRRHTAASNPPVEPHHCCQTLDASSAPSQNKPRPFAHRIELVASSLRYRLFLDSARYFAPAAICAYLGVAGSGFLPSTRCDSQIVCEAQGRTAIEGHNVNPIGDQGLGCRSRTCKRHIAPSPLPRPNLLPQLAARCWVLRNWSANGCLKSLIERVRRRSIGSSWIHRHRLRSRTRACWPMNHSDGVLLVVRSNLTPFEIVRKPGEKFRKEHLVGVVLKGSETKLLD